jgi:hypothetical protein
MARRGTPFPIQIALAAGAGFAGWLALMAASDSFPDAAALITPADSPITISPSTCNIKGNVSIGTGERIYHVPGQHYYTQTRISPQYGERWFCSEAEARAAGWRRAGY